MADRFVRLSERALLPAAAAQMTMPILPLLGVGTPLWSGTELGAMAAPETLPPMAFALLAPVFIGGLVLAGRAQRRSEPGLSQAALPLLALMCMITLWIALSQAGAGPAITYSALLGLVIAGFAAAKACIHLPWAGALTALMAGWLCVVFASETAVLARGLFGLQATDAPWQILFLTWAAAFGAATVLRMQFSASGWALAGLAWGLASLVVHIWATAELNAPAVVFAALSIFGLCALWTFSPPAPCLDRQMP
ncbi:MAG: hypothetical protein AAF753_03815 [Pseudomonadota bacterium]